MRLKTLSAPAVEPVELADMKLHLGVSFSVHDSLITTLITAARTVVESHLRQALITQTSVLYLDGFPSAGGYYNPAIRQAWAASGGGFGFVPGFVPNSAGEINLPRPPVQSVTSVQYWDFQGVLQTIPSGNYLVSLGTPARIQPAYSQVWPVARPTIDAVQVTFVSGYGADGSAVPAPALAAIKLLVGNWYLNRESTVSGTIITSLPDGVEALLASIDHGSYG